MADSGAPAAPTVTPEREAMELALVAIEAVHQTMSATGQAKLCQYVLKRYEQAGFLLDNDGMVSETTRRLTPPFMSGTLAKIDARAKHNKSSRDSKKRSRDARFLDNTIYRTNTFHQDFVCRRNAEIEQEVNQYRAQLEATFEDEVTAMETNLGMYRSLAHVGAESPMESSYRNFLVFVGGKANLCDFSKEAEEYFSRF